MFLRPRTRRSIGKAARLVLLALVAGSIAHCGPEKTPSDADSAAAALHEEAVALYGAGRFAEAIPLEEKALAARRRLLGDDDPRTIVSLSSLGGLLNSTGRLDEALPLLREAVERSRRVLGPDDPQTLGAMNSTAAVHWRKGELDEAQALLRETLSGCRRVFGDDHAFTLSTANNLGVLLTEAGRLEEALPLCREALEGRRGSLGSDHALTLQSMDSVVQALRASRRLDEATAQARELLDHGTGAFGEEHPQVLLWTTTLGTLHLDRGRPEDALAVLAPAEAAARRALTEQEPRRLGVFLAALGLARARTGDYPAAKAALDDAWIVLGDPAVGSTSDLTYVLSNLVELEDAWEAAEPGAGHAEAAADWRAELDALRGE
jgi:tetratricopeptide (TPR) repeat protein